MGVILAKKVDINIYHFEAKPGHVYSSSINLTRPSTDQVRINFSREFIGFVDLDRAINFFWGKMLNGKQLYFKKN